MHSDLSSHSPKCPQAIQQHASITFTTSYQCSVILRAAHLSSGLRLHNPSICVWTENPLYYAVYAMIIRLGRLTPGYFRLLQLQVSGEVASEPKDRLVNHLAFLLALMGLGLSYYSVRQMMQKSSFHASHGHR
ncbi:putative transmembrane protein ZNF593OS [Mantella aurantiaca]